MTFHFADLARQAGADRAITDEEIAAVRRAGWADGQMTREEATSVFELQRALETPTPAWSDFFVEAISNYVLNGTEPRGFANEDEARWLIEQVRADGHVCAMTELEVLTRIIERAHNVPETLKTFVLETLEAEVLSGTGPTRSGGELSDTHVTQAECQLLRRTIFGSASDLPAAVSRREAEMLFRIKDATLLSANVPEFERVFVQGVGNYLTGFASGSGQISRERQLELDAFVADNEVRVGRFMSHMAKSAPNAFGVVFGHRGMDAANREQQQAEAAEVTAQEREWLDTQVAGNGQVDAYDRALIAFVSEELGEA